MKCTVWAVHSRSSWKLLFSLLLDAGLQTHCHHHHYPERLTNDLRKKTNSFNPKWWCHNVKDSTCYSLATLHYIRVFRVSLSVEEEGMISNDSLHCAAVLLCNGLKLKHICGRVYVQSLHVIVDFPKINHTGNSVLLPQSDLVNKKGRVIIRERVNAPSISFSFNTSSLTWMRIFEKSESAELLFRSFPWTPWM